jgi:ACS family glucarate transporter-like MFS transporter
MAEAGAYPGATRAIYNWIPISERGLALGLFNFGARLGAAAGLTTVSYIVIHTGWRSSFLLLGGVGLVWAALWFLLSSDLPQGTAPAIAERKPTGDWKKIALSTPALLLFYQYFAINFTFFIGYSWLLPHLRQEFHLPPARAGVYASIPLYCGAFAAWCGGNIVDRLYRRGYGAMSRAIPAIAGFTLASISVLAAAYVTSAEAFVALFSMAVLGLDLAVSPSWTTCSDLGGPNTGAVSASMNMVGSVGAFLRTIAFPFVIQLTGRTRSYFILATVLNILGALSWIKIGRASHFSASPSQPPEFPQIQTPLADG